jgi:perosamine synthetase
LTKYYKEKFNIDQKSLAVTEKISKEILTLPLYPNMTAEDKDYLVESISEFFEKN